MSGREQYVGPERRSSERRDAEQATDATDFDLLLSDSPELRQLIGRRMGAIRRLQKHSQAVVAQHLGVSRPHLSNIEIGRSRTSWAGLSAMADYYKLGLRELIDDCSAHLADPRGAVRPSKTRTGGEGMQNNNGGEKATAPEMLTDDERFMLGLLRLLATDEQRRIASDILELVRHRSQQIVNHQKNC